MGLLRVLQIFLSCFLPVKEHSHLLGTASKQSVTCHISDLLQSVYGVLVCYVIPVIDNRIVGTLSSYPPPCPASVRCGGFHGVVEQILRMEGFQLVGSPFGCGIVRLVGVRKRRARLIRSKPHFHLLVGLVLDVVQGIQQGVELVIDGVTLCGTLFIDNGMELAIDNILLWG